MALAAQGKDEKGKDEKATPGTGMAKGTMKMALAKARRAPVNCAVGLSKDGRFGLLLMHITKKPKVLVADLIKAVPGARSMRWGSVAIEVDTDPKVVRFQLNKPLAGLDRRLRTTLKATGYNKVEIGDRSSGGGG